MRSATPLLLLLPVLVLAACGDPPSPTGDPAHTAAPPAISSPAPLATAEAAPSAEAAPAADAADAAPAAQPQASPVGAAPGAGAPRAGAPGGAAPGAGASGAPSRPETPSSGPATASATPPTAPSAPVASADAPKGPVTTAASFSAFLGGGTFDAGKPGAVQVVVQAIAPYHVNAEYPFKFTLDAAPAGITYAETTVRNVSRTEMRATLPVSFTAAKAGSYRISGTCSLSVCTPTECQIKKVPLSASITVR